jgi:hypothetical protein
VDGRETERGPGKQENAMSVARTGVLTTAVAAVQGWIVPGAPWRVWLPVET